MDQAGQKIFIADIREGQEITTQFLLDDLRLGQTKTGKPFVSLKLRDKTGEMEARVWDDAERFFHTFTAGDVALIRGTTESYQKQVQMKVTGAKIIDSQFIDHAHFLAAATRPVEEMFSELKGLVETIIDPHLRGLILDILDDPEIGSTFKRSPAAKRFHHAYLGGLLEHTLGLTRTAAAVCRFYPSLNRDLLLAGAVLHDLGKIREFDQGLAGDYTSEGRLLGHLVIGLSLIETKIAKRTDFPEKTALLLKHLIVSHHGEYELGSPKRPKTLEALALHLLDDLDAKLIGLGDYISRHADDQTGWTDYNRLMERYFFRPGPLETMLEEPLGTQDDQTSTVGADTPVGLDLSPAVQVVEQEDVRPQRAEDSPERPDTGQLSLL